MEIKSDFLHRRVQHIDDFRKKYSFYWASGNKQFNFASAYIQFVSAVDLQIL